MRRLRVSGCLAESIQLIKSLRAIGVRSLHRAFAIGVAARALRTSVGTLGPDSSPAGFGFLLFIIVQNKSSKKSGGTNATRLQAEPNRIPSFAKESCF